jgi:hypothetical protein
MDHLGRYGGESLSAVAALERCDGFGSSQRFACRPLQPANTRIRKRLLVIGDRAK